MRENLKYMRVFAKKLTHADVESHNVLPLRHDLHGHIWASSFGDEVLELENSGEPLEVGCKLVQLGVSGSVL